MVKPLWSDGFPATNRSMRELHYIDGVPLVSDDVCLGVFEYAVALAKAAAPTSSPSPYRGTAARQQSTWSSDRPANCSAPTDGENSGVDIDDEDLVRELRRRALRLGPSTAIASEEPNRYLDMAPDIGEH